MEGLSDLELMGRVRAGDHDAFRTLLDRYWPPLLAFAAGMVGSPSTAEDVVQDAFIRVWRARADWSPQGSPRAYLYQVVRNLALNVERGRKVEDRWKESVGQEGSPRPSQATPDETMAAEVLRREVDAAIAQLPERRRAVFLLSRFHGLSHREIAETLQIAPQTVANQMKMALDHLREALRAHFEGG